MKRPVTSWFREVSLALIGCLLLTYPIAASPKAGDGPFADLTGVWGGTGTVTFESGEEKPIICRVQYVQPNKDELQQALSCATEEDNFQVNAIFIHENGVLRGRWWELVFNVSGTISGTVGGGHIEGQLHALGHTANLTMATSNDRQVVSIVTTDLKIRRVDIEVKRSRR